MAKPKACQTPNAEMTPGSSNPANKPELERPFKAERCLWEPSSFCSPWVGPVSAPLQGVLEGGWGDPCAAGQAGGDAPGSSPQPRAQTWHLELGDMESQAAEAPWEGALPQGWLHFPTSRLSCLGSCEQGTHPLAGLSCGCPNAPACTAEVSCPVEAGSLGGFPAGLWDYRI